MRDGLSSTELLPGNVCFGCGQDNPNGLRIAVARDPANARRILGEFHPRDDMIGFPGITHGGAIYTALDCMATWSGMMLRKTKALWILRSATMKYHRPAFQGHGISLSATLEREDEDPWQAIEVRAEARDVEGNVLAEGTFKVIPVPPEKFRALTGIDALPANWAAWLSESEGAETSGSGQGAG
jgi:acyl-coenzyme A thioesterase PaaI-like protein